MVEPGRIDDARDGRVAAVDARTLDGPIDAPTVTARQVAPAIPAPSPRRRWPVAVACVIAIAVGIGAVAGVARLLDRRASGRSATSAVPVTTTPSPATTDTTAGPSTTVTPTVPADVSAIAPTDLVVSTDGGRVLLSWTDHTNGQAPQVVYTYTSGAAPAPTPVSPAGARSQVIPDISPTTPACFVVAVVVSIGQDPSSSAQTVKSDPKCINNAVAKPTAP